MRFVYVEVLICVCVCLHISARECDMQISKMLKYGGGFIHLCMQNVNPN